MTKEQYETTIKAIMKTAIELLMEAKSDKEKIDIMEIKNLQIKAITDEYQRLNG